MRRYLLIGVLLFIALLAWRLPLGWVSPWLPAGVECEGASGSVWRGSCATLRTPRAPLQAVSWQLAILPLLRGSANLSLRIDDPDVQATAEAQLRFSGAWQLQSVHAELPLEHPLIGMAPRDYRGTIVADLADTAGQGRTLQRAAGTVQLLKLRSSADLGSYAVKLQPGAQAGEVLGELRDTGGPLEVAGTLRIHPSGYDLQGQTRARGEPAAELAQALSMLGPADADGRRQFSLEGTF